MTGLPFRHPAIVHDWFQGYHGSERVVEALRSDLFGGHADVLTFHAAREILPPELAAAIVKESRLAGLPGVRQEGHDPGRWRYLLPYMPLYFRRLDLSEYDLVISSSHANASSVHAAPGALHVCYCYTPMRYAWSQEIEGDRIEGVKSRALNGISGALRRVDLNGSRSPDHYIAISESVRDRIRRFYGRDAAVVSPPVDTAHLSPDREKDPQQFLWVHRLVGYKRPELVAEAFRGLPYKLLMVGIGPREQALRAMMPPNVELRGWMERDELERLYEGASGFVHVGEEDFGITMVEALAAGSPVIGLARGGARDIVRDGVDGILLEDATVESIRAAVRAVAEREWDPAALAERARTFAQPHFIERMAEQIDSYRR
jgi:glycosyltransferase involved in cell wall biosynthesis